MRNDLKKYLDSIVSLIGDLDLNSIPSNEMDTAVRIAKEADGIIKELNDWIAGGCA